MKRFRAAALTGLFVGLALPAAAWAQLIPCVQTATGDKVYLDDVRARNAQESAVLDTLMQRVAFKVEASLRSLESRTRPGLRVLSCAARYPSGEDIFTRTLSRNLTTEKVLLEVWSEVHREADEEGEVFLVVDLSVALMPLLAVPAAGIPSGVVRFESRFKPRQKLREVLREIEAKDELWGLARVAAGLRAFNLRQYGPASSALCEGVRSLRGLQNASRRELCAALADHADRTALDARNRSATAGEVPAFVSEAAQCVVTP